MRNRIWKPLVYLLLLSMVFVAPLQALAANPGDEVSATITIAPGGNFYLVLADYQLSDGLEYVKTESSLGGILANAHRAIAWDPNLKTSGGVSSATITVFAKIKDAVTTDQAINFTKIQSADRSDANDADPQSKIIKIGNEPKSADVNGDSAITMRDVMIVLYAFLDGVQAADLPSADLNNDGVIVMRDVMIVLYAFLDAA
ncbi:MAG: dockerin type I domain-containing protein [Christensenellales bacterium]